MFAVGAREYFSFSRFIIQHYRDCFDSSLFCGYVRLTIHQSINNSVSQGPMILFCLFPQTHLHCLVVPRDRMSQLPRVNFLTVLKKLSEYSPSELRTTNEKYVDGLATDKLLLEYFQIGKNNIEFSGEEKQFVRELLPSSFDNITARIIYSFGDLCTEKLITAQILRSGLQFFCGQLQALLSIKFRRSVV